MSIYSEMKEFLTPEKWGKEYLHNVNTKKCCILGAKSMILNGEIREAYARDQYTDKLSQIICEQFPERWYGSNNSTFAVWSFNDNDATTIADIHLILEKADADS